MEQDTGTRYIIPDSLMRPIGFNHGVSTPVGRFLFLSGQIGVNREGHITSSNFVEQFDLALANLLTVVQEAGGKPESIGELTIFVTDMAAYKAGRPAIGALYRKRMGRHFPAMSLVEVKSLLFPEALVEIQGLAVV